MFKRILSSLGKNPWKSYAASIGAEYINGGILHSDQIVVSKSFFTIQINLGTNQRGNTGLIYTRFRSAYTSQNPLYFKIQKRGFFSKMWRRKSNSSRTIVNDYVISHESDKRIYLLLSDLLFWEQIKTFQNFTFVSEKDDGIYGPNFPCNEHQLCMEILQEVKDPVEINKVVYLLEYTIELLYQAGYLSTQPVTVKY